MLVLTKVIVSHIESNGKAWFGRPFDPSAGLRTSSAQDRLTTGGFDFETQMSQRDEWHEFGWK